MTTVFCVKFNFEERPYEAQVNVRWHVEYNYGADADGGRGVYRRFIDEVEVLGVIDDQGGLVTPGDDMMDHIAVIAEERL